MSTSSAPVSAFMPPHFASFPQEDRPKRTRIKLDSTSELVSRQEHVNRFKNDPTQTNYDALHEKDRTYLEDAVIQSKVSSDPSSARRLIIETRGKILEQTRFNNGKSAIDSLLFLRTKAVKLSSYVDLLPQFAQNIQQINKTIESHKGCEGLLAVDRADTRNLLTRLPPELSETMMRIEGTSLDRQGLRIRSITATADHFNNTLCHIEEARPGGFVLAGETIVAEDTCNTRQIIKDIDTLRIIQQAIGESPYCHDKTAEAYFQLSHDLRSLLHTYAWIASGQPDVFEYGKQYLERDLRRLLGLVDQKGENVLQALIKFKRDELQTERAIIKGSLTWDSLPDRVRHRCAGLIWAKDGQPDRPGHGENDLRLYPIRFYEVIDQVRQELSILKVTARALKAARLEPKEASIEQLAENIGPIDEGEIKSLRVIHVTAELGGITSQGGLGPAVLGIADSMAQAVGKKGKVRVFMPLYSTIPQGTRDRFKRKEEYDFTDFKGRKFQVWKHYVNGVCVYFIDHPAFNVDNETGKSIYGGDQISRFAVLQSAAADLILEMDEMKRLNPKGHTIDVVQAHDAQTGMVPELLRKRSDGAGPATLFTFHNTMTQVKMDSCQSELVGLSGNHNAFVEGVLAADMASTVSKTYAKEAQGPLGNGAGSTLMWASQQGKLVGIPNGNTLTATPPIDPASDIVVVKKAAKVELKRQLNRLELGTIDVDKPLFVYLGRYDSGQKGIEYLKAIRDAVLENGGQFLCIGIDPDDTAKSHLADLKKDPRDGSVVIIDQRVPGGLKYQQIEGLGERIRNATDVSVNPSKYEPFGLSDTEALQRGAKVLATRTGGFVDKYGEGSGMEHGTLFDRDPANQDRIIRDAVSKMTRDVVGEFTTRSVDDWNRIYRRRMQFARDWAWDRLPDGRIPPVRSYQIAYTAAKRRARTRRMSLQVDFCLTC